MDSLEVNEEVIDQDSPLEKSGSSINMQLLSVPCSASHQGGTSASSTSSSKDAKFMRRYSCNPSAKGSNSHPEAGGSSPSMMRRSSLAAIKWSVLARRISMGLAHEREAPEDPSKVCNSSV